MGATPRRRDLVEILDAHERSIKRLSQTVARVLSSGITDHGALSGLGDDDHTQYALLTGGSRAVFSGIVKIASGTALALEHAFPEVRFQEVGSDGTDGRWSIYTDAAANTMHFHSADPSGLEPLKLSRTLVTVGVELKVSSGVIWVGDNDYLQHSEASNYWRVVLDNGEYFRVNTSGQALHGNGTALLPGMSFISDANTGFYRSAENQIAFSAGGAYRAFFDTTKFEFAVPVQISDGTAASPGFRFLSDTDLGFARNGTNQGAFIAAAKAVAIWQPPGYNVATGARGEGALWVYSNSSGGLGTTAGNNIVLQSWHGTDSNQAELRLELLRDVNGSSWTTSAWGFRRITDSSSQASLWFKSSSIGVNTSGPVKTLGVVGTVALRPTTGSGFDAHFVNVTGSEYELYRVTSARKYKTDERHADYLANIKLEPKSFLFQGEDGDGEREIEPVREYGFIADDLAAQDPLLGHFVEGEIENYSTRGIIAVLAAKVNRLEAQVAELLAET